ncbi:MAG TPA: hypothetical protein PKZ91_03585, partial [Saprospiraceae bacterium]|nr:hypothetical protein [Saprospiraceae bacterium]
LSGIGVLISILKMLSESITFELLLIELEKLPITIAPIANTAMNARKIPRHDPNTILKNDLI